MKFSLLILFFLSIVIDANSQVTIGSLENPIEGAILQLKNGPNITDNSANATKGLLLPKVSLSAINGLVLTNKEISKEQFVSHKGLVVYNVSNNHIPQGIYVWNGVKWNGNYDNIKDEWDLLWEENFESSNNGLVSTNDWGYEWWAKYNNEEQDYTSADLRNVRIEDGVLILEAQRWSSWGKSGYTSGRISTNGKHSICYGKVEVSAKLPKGRGIFPAIWMMPVNSDYGGWPNSGEIDIMEFIGIKPEIIHTTVHTEYSKSSGNPNEPQVLTNVLNLHDNFNTFSLEWTPRELRFLINNKVVNTYYNTSKGNIDDYKKWPFDKPFYLILNVAVGGNWAGSKGIDDSIFPQRMEIDYIRLYQYSKSSIP